MKHLFFPIAIMALFLTACDKEKTNDEPSNPGSTYEKTLVSVNYKLSEDYLYFFDVAVSGKDFDGKDIKLDVDTIGSFSFETTASQAEATLHVTVTKKQVEIDTTAVYNFSSNFAGSIRAKVKGKDAFMSMQSFDFMGGSLTIPVSGDRLIQHPEFFERRCIDKTMRLTATPDGNSVSVDAQPVEKPE